MANPVKIPLPNSSYSAQLRGVTGKNTEGIIIQGSYDANWDMYVFNVDISGPYELYVDPAGGTNYTKDSVWSGPTGKWVPGQDMIDAVN